MTEELTDEEKADEVLQYAKGGINYRMPSPAAMRDADLVIGDRRSKYGPHKYDILKCRYPHHTGRRRVLQSTVQLFEFLHGQVRTRPDLRVLWVVPR